MSCFIPYCSKYLHIAVLWGKILLHCCALSYYGRGILYGMGEGVMERNMYTNLYCASLFLSLLRGPPPPHGLGEFFYITVSI